MTFLFDLIKILLLALIAVLLSADVGLLTLPPPDAILARLGIVDGDAALEPDTTVSASSADAAHALVADVQEADEALPDEVTVVDEQEQLLSAELSNDATTPLGSDVEGEPAAAAEAVAQPLDAVASANETVDINTDVIDTFATSNVADDSLQALLRARLADRYEFPEHIKFRNTHLSVQRLFADAGIDVEREQEVVFAVYCGDYSAPNPAGLYGGYRPFYTEVLVSHADQSIDGELWLDVDGDIKKSISFRSDLLISARQESFDRRFNQYCGSRKGFLTGEYADYTSGQLAPYYRQHFAAMASKASDPDYAERLAECLQTDATLKECYRNLGD